MFFKNCFAFFAFLISFAKVENTKLDDYIIKPVVGVEQQSILPDVNKFINCIQSDGGNTIPEIKNYLNDITVILKQTMIENNNVSEDEKLDNLERILKLYLKELRLEILLYRPLEITTNVLQDCLTEISDFRAIMESFSEEINIKIDDFLENGSTIENKVSNNKSSITKNYHGTPINMKSIDSVIEYNLPASYVIENQNDMPKFSAKTPSIKPEDLLTDVFNSQRDTLISSKVNPLIEHTSAASGFAKTQSDTIVDLKDATLKESILPVLNSGGFNSDVPVSPAKLSPSTGHVSYTTYVPEFNPDKLMASKQISLHNPTTRDLLIEKSEQNKPISSVEHLYPATVEMYTNSAPLPNIITTVNSPLGDYNEPVIPNNSDSQRRILYSTNKNIETKDTMDGNLKAGISVSENGKNSFLSKSNNDISSISLFSSSFYQKVTSFELLHKAFNLTIPLSNAGQIFYDTFYNTLKDFEILKPNSLARIIADAVESTFDNISSCALIKIFSNAIGQYLFKEHVLANHNYSLLSTKLSTAIIESLNVVEQKEMREFYIQSIIKGTLKFLFSLGVFTSENANIFATYLANEFLFSEEEFEACYKDILPNDILNQTPETPYQSLLANYDSLNETFSSIVVKQLILSENLMKFFDLQLTADEAASIFYNNIYEIAANIGMTDSSIIAWTFAQAISTNLDYMSPVSFAYVVANSLENFLITHAFLTSYNAKELANSYIRSLTQASITIPLEKSPASYIKALIKATRNFIAGQFLLDIIKPDSISSLFINELRFTNSINHSSDSLKVKINLSFPLLLWDVAPEIYSSVGLSSEKATSRIQNLAETLSLDLASSTAAGVDMNLLAKNFVTIASEIHRDNPDLKTEGLILGTLLEIMLAIIEIINASNITYINVSALIGTNVDLANILNEVILHN